jgi:hypothetical protein
MDVLLFVLLAGALATFVHGYHYGQVNQVEHIPRILRILDSTYLAGDFIIDSTSGYGVRYFYSMLAAGLGWLFSLPIAFLLMVLVQNTLLAAVTFYAARQLSSSGDVAAVLAAVLVLSVRSVEIGGLDFLFSTSPDPSQVALPLALFSLWLGLNGRPWISLGTAVPAALLHPVLGLQCGIVGLVVCLLFEAVAQLRSRAGPHIRLRKVWQPAVSLLIFLVFFAAVWLLPRTGQTALSTSMFLGIYGQFRLPHHVLPSFFRFRDYVALAAFLAAGSVSWCWHYRRTTDQSLLVRIACILGIALVSWVAGYVFVEVVPTRVFASLQAFRSVAVVKWVGLMLLAGTIADLWRQPDEGRMLTGTMLFLPTGFAQPHAVLWGHLAELIRRRFRASDATARTALLALTMLAAAAIVLFGGYRNQEFLALAALGAVGAVLLYVPCRVTRYGLAVLLTVMVMGLILLHKYRPMGPLDGLLRDTQPRFTLSELKGPQSGVAEFARTRTPEDAVFIVPPMWDQFRILAERAVVVDFKDFPFDDRTMLEWRRRLADCYGETRQRGFAAASEMQRHYASIPEGRLLWLREKYGATYAVLFERTPCRFPLLYVDDRYKLVAIPETVSE